MLIKQQHQHARLVKPAVKTDEPPKTSLQEGFGPCTVLGNEDMTHKDQGKPDHPPPIRTERGSGAESLFSPLQNQMVAGRTSAERPCGT